jgi:PAS domain S-box-containing protein
LLAIAWILVAALRIHQLDSDAANNMGDAAQLWAVVTLTVLAALYLVWSTVTSRAHAKTTLDEAYHSIARLEQVTEIAMAHLPTDELVHNLLRRIQAVLQVDSAVILQTTDDGQLEVTASVGLPSLVLADHKVRRGIGLAGRVAAQGVAMSTPDVSQIDVSLEALREHVASAAAAPMFTGERVIGVLVVGSATPRTFDDESMKLLQLAADRSASALESARLRDAERRLFLATEHARGHLRLLVDASRVFMESVTDYEGALVQLVELATREFAAFGAVYLAEGGKGLHVLVAQHSRTGPNEALRTFRDLPASALDQVREAMATGQSKLVKSLDPTGYVDDHYRASLHALGLTSYVMVPIVVRGLAYGALVLGTAEDMRGFRPSDLAATEELARRAALAVEASLLYLEARDSAQLAETYASRLRNLLDAWLSIAAALDRPDGLTVAANGARRVLEADGAYLLLGDEVHGTAAASAAPMPTQVWTYLRTLDRPARSGQPDLPEMPAAVAVALPEAWIAAPLKDVTNTEEGLLLVTGKRAGEFDGDDESLLVLLAQMIAAALANTHLHAKTRENEARLTALIQSSPVAIVDLALDGVIRSWNVAAATLFDWPADASSGWRASFDPQMTTWIASLSSEALADGVPAHLECTFIRDDGVEKALTLSVSPVNDHSGTTTGMLLVADDETERRQLARQFHEAQRLDAVGRMAGGVAHDFNNLLTVILGYADSLLRRMPEDDPHRERIATIARAGNRGAALTRQLLAVSRRQVVAPIVLRPVDVFDELEGMISRLIGEDVHVYVDGDGDKRSVRIDKSQLEQVLLNLAANARDAMAGGGDLFLETRPAADPSYVAVVVRDTGAGMDEETLAHCLEPFYTTKDRGEGTGLGLAAVHGIITQSGGEVSVVSQPGAGTTVTLLLPVVDAPLEYAPATVLPTPTSTTVAEAGNILLVEDEQELRSMVRRQLRERGYTVLQAHSAAAALAMLAEYGGPLDLLITDVVMPGMKGPELARRVALERQVPVLFMSGYAEELVDVPADFGPAAAFLAKPFTPDQLVDAVRKMVAVGRARANPPAAQQPSAPVAEGADRSEGKVQT